MTARRIARYAKLVLHDEVYAWLALGWMLHRDLNGRYPCDGTYQGDYAALLVWPCDCQVRRPTTKPNNCASPACNPADAIEGRCCGWIESCDEDALQRDTQRDYDEEREFGWSVL